MKYDMDAMRQLFNLDESGHKTDEGKYIDFWYGHDGSIWTDVFIDSEKLNVSVSSHPSNPFGHDSLFEYQTLFDTCEIEYEKEFYNDTPILVFNKNHNGSTKAMLKIIKWENGNYSVWADGETDD